MVPRVGDDGLKRTWSDSTRRAVHSFIASYALASFAAGFLLFFGALFASAGTRRFPDTALEWSIALIVYLYGAVWFSILVMIFAAIPAIPLILALRFAGAAGPLAHALAGLCAALISVAGQNRLIFFARDITADWPTIAVGAVAGLVYWYAFAKIYAGLARRELGGSDV
jgi:hypothetical protein